MAESSQTDLSRARGRPAPSCAQAAWRYGAAPPTAPSAASAPRDDAARAPPRTRPAALSSALSPPIHRPLLPTPAIAAMVAACTSGLAGRGRAGWGSTGRGVSCARRSGCSGRAIGREAVGRDGWIRGSGRQARWVVRDGRVVMMDARMRGGCAALAMDDSRRRRAAERRWPAEGPADQGVRCRSGGRAA